MFEKITSVENLLAAWKEFVKGKRKRVEVETLASGIDFLGWVLFSTHRVLRTTTKRRMLSRVNEKNLASYLGLCKYWDTYKIQKKLYTNLKTFK